MSKKLLVGTIIGLVLSIPAAHIIDQLTLTPWLPSECKDHPWIGVYVDRENMGSSSCAYFSREYSGRIETVVREFGAGGGKR